MTSLDLYFRPCSYSPGCRWPLLLPGLAPGPCPARCPPGPPGPFPQSCSLGRLEPVLLQRVLPSSWRALHLSLLNFMMPLSAHSSRLLGMAALPSNISSGGSIWCHCKPDNQALCYLLLPIGKDFKQIPGTGPRTDRCGVPLVASLQVKMSYYPLPSKPNQPSRLKTIWLFPIPTIASQRGYKNMMGKNFECLAKLNENYIYALPSSWIAVILS